jgi:hypothetical protein
MDPAEVLAGEPRASGPPTTGLRRRGEKSGAAAATAPDAAQWLTHPRTYDPDNEPTHRDEMLHTLAEFLYAALPPEYAAELKARAAASGGRPEAQLAALHDDLAKPADPIEEP